MDVCKTVGVDILAINNKNKFLYSEKKIRCICFLSDNIDTIVTKEELINHIWSDTCVSKNVLPVLIHEVRYILMKGGKNFILQPIRGVGYMLVNKTNI
ncbi:transcriptional regulator [Aeromonas sp. A3]